MQILDCTLRDGGYYTNWDFSEELVNRYLQAIACAGVNICEIGFRSLSNKTYRGPLAFSTDEYLSTLSIPSPLILGVMINACELCEANHWEDVINTLFPSKAQESKVSLVRIATHYHESRVCIEACQALKDKGYQVGINLMQISDRTEEEIKSFTKSARGSSADVLYFADSMGSMTSLELEKVFSYMSSEWQGEIGIHMHDNTSTALANSMAGKKIGASWIDATITGMGRGAGNTKLEEFIVSSGRYLENNNSLVPLMNLIKDHFNPLKSKYKWGSNPFYYIAAINSIHPSYVQNMLADTRFETEDILAALDYLKLSDSSRYKPDTLTAARGFFKESAKGSWMPVDEMLDREVLLLGPGPGIRSHKRAIEHYIRSNNPIVIALNANKEICEDLITFRIACHPIRMIADTKLFSHSKTPLITPVSSLPSNLIAQLRDASLLDFGIGIKSNTFAFFSDHCILPNCLVLSYALAVATSGRARTISMAGFDGYLNDSGKNNEVEHLLQIYTQAEDSVELNSITPTRYTCITTRSVYCVN